MNPKATLLTTALVAAIATSAFAGSRITAFSTMLHGYENVRVTLASDNFDGVAKRAAGIARVAGAAAKQYNASDAGVAAAHEAEGRAVLERVASAATALSRASNLEIAREVFGDLSNAMIDLRAIAEGERARVATCPMAKKSWIQPDGEIGNPYLGASMPKCGEFVE